MKSERRIKKIQSVIEKRQPDLTVVLENIHDPHNVSAILRSCDAAGILMVNLVYNTERFPKPGKKSSASAYKWVDSRKFQSINECFSQLKREGFLIAASVVSDKSESLYKLDLTKKIALVFGNEHRGVSQEALEKADILFRIPMFGMVQSLNVSVACGITIYEALRQRLEIGIYDTPRISGDDFQYMIAEWLKR
ncbi:MAG: TrmH family RNA methyltransferase [Candidatus Kryptoniota bacterium]